MSPRRIHVVIDELSLRGFEPQQRARVVMSLERELGRLFHTYPSHSRNGFVERLITAPIQIAPRTSTATLGARLAERVHGAAVAAAVPVRQPRGRT